MQSVLLTISLFITLLLLLFSSLSSIASAADASGNVGGTIMCTGNPVGQNSSLVLSAFMGDVPVYGNWEITSFDSSGNTISVTGYLNAGNIGGDSFSLEGMVTSDSICGIQVPSEVALMGDCGSSGSVRIASNDVLEGHFMGDIQCTS
jgi:hypothetical protein